MISRQQWIFSCVLACYVGFFAAALIDQRGEVEAAVAGASSQFIPLAKNPTQTIDRVERYHISPLLRSKDEALTSLNLTINPADQVQFLPDPALGLGSEITITRATPIMVDNGGSRTHLGTFQTTVRDLLEEEAIVLGSQDLVDPALDAGLWWGGRVIITRVEEGQYTAVEDINFEVETREDPTKFQDEVTVLREGKSGKREVTVRFRRENGQEVIREVLSETLLANPVTKIVRQGTKLRPATGRWEDLINEIAPRYGADPVGLTAIMMCESGGNLTSYNPVGPYIGMFQFHPWTFENMGGYSMDQIYDARAQIDAAARLYSARYWHWPVCSRGT